MTDHRFDIYASRDRIKRADFAIDAQLICVSIALGDDKVRAERNLETLVDMRATLGRTHAMLIARELGVPYNIKNFVEVEGAPP